MFQTEDETRMRDLTLDHHRKQLELQVEVAALKGQIANQPSPGPSTDPTGQRDNG